MSVSLRTLSLSVSPFLGSHSLCTLGFECVCAVVAAFRGGLKDHRHKTDLISQIQARRRAGDAKGPTTLSGSLGVVGGFSLPFFRPQTLFVAIAFRWHVLTRAQLLGRPKRKRQPQQIAALLLALEGGDLGGSGSSSRPRGPSSPLTFHFYSLSTSCRSLNRRQRVQRARKNGIIRTRKN